MNTINRQIDEHLSDDDFVEMAAQLAKADAQYLNFKIQTRLAEGRRSAVSRAAALQDGTIMPTSVITWFSHVPTQVRMIGAIFAIVIASLFVMQQINSNNNLEMSDAYLLASELPPEAFADKGFNTWLASAGN